MVARTMPRLHHLCLDASAVTSLAVLETSIRLRVLTLYRIAAAHSYGGAGVAELIQLEDLRVHASVAEQWFPANGRQETAPPVSAGLLLSPEIVALTCLPPRTIVAFTVLTEADPSFGLEAFENDVRVNMRALTAHMPELTYLDVLLFMLELGDIARWCPRLEVCKTWNLHYPQALDVRCQPLRLQHASLLLDGQAHMPPSLDPAELRELVCRGYSIHWNSLYQPARLALPDAVRFERLRSLRLHMVAHALDARTLRALCTSLKLLERRRRYAISLA